MDAHHHHLDRMITALDMLTTPQDVTNIHGMTHPMDPILDQLISATHGMSGGGTGTMGAGYGSKTPIWTAGHDWCTALNTTLTALGKRAGVTIPRRDVAEAVAHTRELDLAAVTSQYLDHTATQLEHHHRMALKLLFPPMFELVAPCPECTATHTHHQGADGGIRSAALTVHEMWAECGACGHIWDGIDVIDLARVLNHPPVATVLPATA